MSDFSNVEEISRAFAPTVGSFIAKDDYYRMGNVVPYLRKIGE